MAAHQANYAGKPVSVHKRVGSFMAVGLDLDGNGTITITTTTVAQNATRAPGGQAINFNWDNTSYPKKVGSVSANDAMLVLDKDFNQSVDNGTELLSNPLVADAAKGLRSLAVQDELGGNYSQICSGLRPYNGDIWVKNLKDWSLNGGIAGITATSRCCARADKRARQIVQRKKCQCQRHMVIVRY